MAKPVMTVTSDLHLEQHAWKNHPSLAGDAYYGLRQTVDVALAHEVKALAMLGDVFNVKTPDPHTVSVCYTEVERCKRAGVKVPYLQGQHELSRNTPWLAIHPWPMHLHKLCLEVADGIVAYGLDWTPAGQVKRALAEVPPEANLLLCHQVWGDFHGSKIEHECDFADVPGHVRVLITGDYHKHFTLATVNGGGGNMGVASPGSTCLQSINEDPSKACFLLYDDMTLKSVPIKSRVVRRLRVNDRGELDRTLDRGAVVFMCQHQDDVPANIAKPIVQVTYNDEIPEAHDRLVGAFGDKVHLFLVPVRGKPEEIQIQQEERRERAARGLAGALTLVLPQGSPVLADAVRLNNSPDPGAELDRMEEEFLSAYQERPSAAGEQGGG